MDVELMRRLSPRVNVIPVIGKADSLTPSELRGFKKRVSYFRKGYTFVVLIGLLLGDGRYRAPRYPRLQLPV